MLNECMWIIEKHIACLVLETKKLITPPGCVEEKEDKGTQGEGLILEKNNI